jgi:hypothetical protein
MSLLFDEKGKRRLRQWGSLPFITRSSFGGSSLPQNPGVGQKTCLDRNILGSGKIDGIEEMTIVKLSHQLDRSLPLNDMCESENPLRFSGVSVRCQMMVSRMREKNRGGLCNSPLFLWVLFLWHISKLCYQEKNGAFESKY